MLTLREFGVTRRTFASIIIEACFWIVVITFMLNVLISWQRPDCPTEDSCTIDYIDGQWVITEEGN